MFNDILFCIDHMDERNNQTVCAKIIIGPLRNKDGRIDDGSYEKEYF